MPHIETIMTWMKDNQLMLGLLASAVIGAMPELLPSWRQFPQWLWTWIRDSSKMFLNFRRMPQPPEPTSSSTVTASKVTVSTVTTNETDADKPKRKKKDKVPVPPPLPKENG